MHQGNGQIPTRAQVAAAIADTRELQTVTGSITFNSDGNIRNPYVSYYSFDANGKSMFLNQFVLQTTPL